MIIDYLFSEKKNISLYNKKRKNFIKINEDENLDPTSILRSHGIKIKRIIPKEKYIEVYLFDDLKDINFSYLKDFYFKLDDKDNKILISYTMKR